MPEDLIEASRSFGASSSQMLWKVQIPVAMPTIMAGINQTLMLALSMVVIAFHLWHGFQSSFQTLGLNHKKYTPFIQGLGKAYAILIPLGFALIPILFFLKYSSVAQ